MHKPETGRHGYNPMENYLKVTGLTINYITLLSQSEINPNMSEYPSAKGVKVYVRTQNRFKPPNVATLQPL